MFEEPSSGSKSKTYFGYELAKKGITMGSHTVNHARLTDLDEHGMAEEITASKSMLEGELGKPVKHFAYPYGKMDELSLNMVKKSNYASACSTRSGFNNRDTDSYLLRRIEVYGSDSIWRFALKVMWGTNDASVSMIFKYYSSRLKARFE